MDNFPLVSPNSAILAFFPARLRLSLKARWKKPVDIPFLFQTHHNPNIKEHPIAPGARASGRSSMMAGGCGNCFQAWYAGGVLRVTDP
jgi:hypothetical protein